MNGENCCLVHQRSNGQHANSLLPESVEPKALSLTIPVDIGNRDCSNKWMAKDFNTGEPIAYFLTWTTYGTWIPGDGRGWNRKGEPEIMLANPLFEEMAMAQLKEDPFLLNHQDRSVVESTIRKHCEIRNWTLHALNARSNHIHVVVTSVGYQPDTVAAQFKAWCIRRLKTTYLTRKKFWTQGSSCKWVNTEDSLSTVIEYALHAQ